MTEVKICGLRRVDDALVAVDAGAAMIGLVFAPSRRQIDVQTAAVIAGTVKGRSRARVVGIFVNATAASMNRAVADCGLDLVQLSGDEPDTVVAELDVPAIRTIHVGPDDSAESLARRIEESSAHMALLDTARSGAYGGTGETFNWDVIPQGDRPVLLAGGLHPGNVADAIRLVKPWGIDVSSGVETGGVKDQQKIKLFLRSALT